MKHLPLGIRLEPQERTALEHAARREQRPISALGRKIITDWLRQNGWFDDGLKAGSSDHSGQLGAAMVTRL